MAVYIVTGRLGSGKTLWAMTRIRDAIRAGKPIATNLDLHLDHLPEVKAPIYRIPDQPKAADLHAIGQGSDSQDEATFGWLVLDEAGTWLNSREWSGGDRPAVIAWLLHARKLHWNVILLIQHASMLDKQVRDALTEFHVVCRRGDRMRLPFVGNLLAVLSLGRLTGNLPKVHSAAVRYGIGPSSMHVENDYYRAKDLYAAYDTDQKITSFYEHGLYCCLPPAMSVKPATKAQRPALKPKLRAVQMAMRLDPDKRVDLMRRIEARGLDLKAV